MAARAFVDTGILLRAVFVNMERHKKGRDILDRLIYEEEEGKAQLWISGQVVREFITQAAKRTKPPTTRRALDQLEYILPSFQVAEETKAMQTQFRQLLRDYAVPRKAVHDANIVATMLTHDIETIYTLDSHFTQFKERIKVLPNDGDTPNEDQ